MAAKLMRVLVGVHTAGKSSVGNRLGELGYLFYPEIALQVLESSAGPRRPWELSASFDERVIVTELERDALFLNHTQRFFVETWHIGNLAYARLRNSAVAIRYERQVRAHVREFEPTVYYLDMPTDLIRTRTTYYDTEDDHARAAAFYAKMRSELLRVLQLLHITPVVVEASQGIGVVTDAILRHEKVIGDVAS